MLLACSDAIRRITVGPLWRWLLHAQIVIVPLALLFSEHVRQPLASRKRVYQPPGCFRYRAEVQVMLLAGTVRRRWRSDYRWASGVIFPLLTPRLTVFTVPDSDQTIPSVALFGLLIAPLAGLKVKQFPWLAEFGVAGTTA